MSDQPTEAEIRRGSALAAEIMETIYADAERETLGATLLLNVMGSVMATIMCRCTSPEHVEELVVEFADNLKVLVNSGDFTPDDAPHATH